MFPRLLELGPITLHTYGLMLATAFLVSTALAAYLGERDGFPRHRAWDLGFVIIISALVGAKLLMVLTDFSYYAQNPSRFLSLEFWQAGGAYFGGLIGATIGSFLYMRRFPKLSFWVIADAAAPSIALGQAIGRIGCFAAGCDYGKPTSQPWGVTFTSQYAHDNVGVPLDVALHPVQLYESIAALGLCLALYWLHGHRSFTGQVFLAYFAGYGLIRFVNEFFRGDRGRGFVIEDLLSVHQLIAILALVGATVLYLRFRSRPATRV